MVRMSLNGNRLKGNQVKILDRPATVSSRTDTPAPSPGGERHWIGRSGKAAGVRTSQETCHSVILIANPGERIENGTENEKIHTGYTAVFPA